MRKPRARPAPRPAQVLRRITLPLLAYSIVSSFILTFITSIEQFAIPQMIGAPGRIYVLASQLYLLCRFPPTDYGLAAAVGLTLSAITGLAIWAQRRIVGSARLTTVGGKAGRLAPIRLGRWKWAGLSLDLRLCLPGADPADADPDLHVADQFFNANPFAAALHDAQLRADLGTTPTHSALVQNTIIASGIARRPRRGARLPRLLLHPAPAAGRLAHARLGRQPALRRAGRRHRPRPAVGLRLPAAAALRHAGHHHRRLHHPLPALRHRDHRRPDGAGRQEPRGGGLGVGREPRRNARPRSCCRS